MSVDLHACVLVCNCFRDPVCVCVCVCVGSAGGGGYVRMYVIGLVEEYMCMNVVC
jgi:hypothetical protein